MLVKELIHSLKTSYNQDAHIAVHIWSTDDVITQAKQLNIEMSQSQAEEIIDEIDDNTDSELGITWETLKCWIQDYQERGGENG